MRLAVTLWLAIGVAVAVRTLIAPATHTVFPIYATAASHWWADAPLYAHYEPLDYFRYPPPFAVAISPLSACGLRLGGILWTWLGAGVYLAGLWQFAREMLPGSWTPTRRAGLLALGALGALPGLWNAQANALVVGLLLLAGVSLVQGRWWRAAFLLAGSVAIKLTPLAPALLLLALWPGRLGPRLALALALAALLPFLTRPPQVVLEHYREWGQHLTQSSGERWPGFRDGWTICLVIRHWAAGEPGPFAVRAPVDSAVYRCLQGAAAFAALAWCLWQRRRGAPERWLVKVTLAMGCAWLMLFGPAVEHATYVFLTPFLVAAVLEREVWPRGRWLVWTACVLVLVLGWSGLTRPWQDQAPWLLTCLPLGTALFTVWLLGYAAACRFGKLPIEPIGQAGAAKRSRFSQLFTVKGSMSTGVDT